MALMQAPPCESCVQPVVSGAPLVQTSWSQSTGPASSEPPSGMTPLSRSGVPASSPATGVSPKQLGDGVETGVGAGVAGDSVQVAPLPSGKLPENDAFGDCMSKSVHSFSHL